MPTIKIDNQDYDTDTLSTEALAQLQSLQFCDAAGAHRIQPWQARSFAITEYLAALCASLWQKARNPDGVIVCALIAQDKLLEPAYTSPAGPTTPLDILYGHRPPMARGNLYMAHRCGFTQKVLTGTLQLRVRPAMTHILGVNGCSIGA